MKRYFKNLAVLLLTFVIIVVFGASFCAIVSTVQWFLGTSFSVAYIWTLIIIFLIGVPFLMGNILGD